MLGSMDGKAADRDDADSRVIANFFDADGRLKRIPAREGHRLVVMTLVAERFERGMDYSDAEVRSILSAVNEDHALMRRFLVDRGLLVRDARGTRYRRP